MSREWSNVEKKMAQAREVYAAASALGEANCERVALLIALAADVEAQGRSLAMASGCTRHLRIHG